MAEHPTHPDAYLVHGEFYATDPHSCFTWMRQHAPVYWCEKSSVWGVTLHDDVQRLSRDADSYCNRHGMRPDSIPVASMINLDDPDHKRRRALVNKGFTVRRVQEQEPKIREICVDLIERAKEKGRFDFVRDVAAPLPMAMIGDMLGVEPEDREPLLRWSDELIEGATMTAPMEKILRAGEAFAEYAEYHRKVVENRRSRPLLDDLMSILVHAEIDGEKLDDEALLQDSLLILVGGDETTRHVITGGMHELLRNPDQMRKLVDNPALVPSAVEEMLRWVTPIQNMSRTATRDLELRGQKVREGDKLLLLYPSANRDENVFHDPFRFDVERKPNEHLAFGGYGTHFCLGASLARLEMRVMFEEIVRRIPDVALVSDDRPKLRPSNFIVGITEMEVECRQ